MGPCRKKVGRKSVKDRCGFPFGCCLVLFLLEFFFDRAEGEERQMLFHRKHTHAYTLLDTRTKKHSRHDRHK